ncbi:MAG: hypothetical protein AAF799_07860 [Myxococcota bacterium]
MTGFRWLAVPLIVGMCLPPIGCGLFRRRGNTTTNVQSSVEINQQGRDVATIERDEYEVIDTSIGTSKATSVYFLTIPVGNHTTGDEQIDAAYYNAVDRIPECDALMMPRVTTKRTLVPLLIVNIMVRKTTVKGRCLHIKDDATLAGEEPIEDGASDTGGGGDEPAVEPATESTEPGATAEAG